MRHLIDILEDNIGGTEPNGFCILKPGFEEHSGEFIGLLGDAGWKVLRKNNRKFSEEEAEQLYYKHKDKPFYNDLCRYMGI